MRISGGRTFQTHAKALRQHEAQHTQETVRRTTAMQMHQGHEFASAFVLI